MHTPL